ncbi:MAG TPA: hypothetical protein VHH73_01745 [Verrucomicrobiae bacterium]|nr:hypothetical protein [Verrucomicrobiae bacterium]
MKFFPTLRHCLLLAGLALALPNLGQAQAATAQAAEAPAAPRFTLETHNGNIIEGNKVIAPATVGNILDYLKKKNNSFSLSLGPGVANITVGDMVLQMENFSIDSICSAIVNCANAPLHTQSDNGVTLLYTTQQQRQVAVFNLTPYLNPDGKAIEKVVEAKLEMLRGIISRTLEDLNPYGPTDQNVGFQFHSGANLLVVTGSDPTIAVVRQVVAALTQPTLPTMRQGGFIPEGAPNPDLSAYIWTNGGSTPSELQSALYQARMFVGQGKATPELLKAIADLTELSTKYGPNHPEIRQKLTALEALTTMLSSSQSPGANPPTDNQPKR